MSIKVLGMLPLKSTVQSDFSGSFLFVARFIAPNHRISALSQFTIEATIAVQFKCWGSAGLS